MKRDIITKKGWRDALCLDDLWWNGYGVIRSCNSIEHSQYPVKHRYIDRQKTQQNKNPSNETA